MESLQQDQTCRICGTQVKAPTARKYDDTHSVQCWTCGDYEIRPEAYLLLFSVYAEQKRYLLSGRARMSVIETGVIHRFDVEEIQAMQNLQLRDKTFSESAVSVVRYLAAQRPGTDIPIGDTDYSIGYCKDAGELRFLVEQLEQQGLLTILATLDHFAVTLSGRGWQWLEGQIREGGGQQAFIAMSFAAAMKPVEDALRAGIVAAGYNAVLVKDRDFTDGIVDRVYAEVRRSHFVVADFTENNNGAYFEAGYGLGLGLRVIGTCEAIQLDPANKDRVHFDVRGMNIIGWRRVNLDDLTQRLKQRILALFPQGPVKPDQQ
jgi:hypothetical protein